MTSPEYYKKNKERILAKVKEYYLAHKEQALAYQRQHRKINRNKLTLRERNKRRSRLEQAVQLLGGKCNNCLGIFDPSIYDFHHINPKEKSFTVGENWLVGEVKLQTEILKCKLLCANCHRLEHKRKYNGEGML